MSVVQVSEFNALLVYVDDLRASEKFYTEILGMRRGKDQPPGILLQAGQGESGVTLYLEGGRKPREGAGERHPVVCGGFGVEGSLAAARERLARAGVTVLSDIVRLAPTFAVFRIADPSGNVVELAGTP